MLSQLAADRFSNVYVECLEAFFDVYARHNSKTTSAVFSILVLDIELADRINIPTSPITAHNFSIQRALQELGSLQNAPAVNVTDPRGGLQHHLQPVFS